MAKYERSEAWQGQELFLSVNLSEQLLRGTFEWTLDKIVDTELDMSGFDSRYRNDREGRPAIDPRALLKLTIYGYSQGILSSRKLEKLSRENIVAKALTRDVEPDHATIAEFVSGNCERVKELFTEILLICGELGLIKGEMFALDGCRLSSNAGKEWSGTLEKLKHKQEKFEKRVAALLERHKSNDAAGDAGEQKRLEKAIKRLRKKSEYIKTFLDGHPEDKQGVSGKAIQSNITDNESARISGPHGVIQGYVGLAVADKENQVIVTAEARGTDYEGSEFADMLDKTEEALRGVTGKEKPLKDALMLSDTNYFSEDNLQAAKDRGIEVLIPDPHFRERDAVFGKRAGHKSAKGKEGKKKYGVEDFKYNEEANTYTCPAGKVLVYKGKTGLRHHRVAKRYTLEEGACADCPLREQCMTSRGGKKPHRTLYLTEGNEEWLSELMRKKIDDPEQKARYANRMGIIEPVFGNMEYCKGMNRFTLRGKAKVDAQWKLYAIVHNIGKCVRKYGERYAG